MCRDCERRIVEIKEPYCHRCGLPLPPGVDFEEDCRWCRGRKIHYDASRSVLAYQTPVREIVRKFKFHRSYGMGRYLRTRLAGRAQSAPEFFGGFDEMDLIVPVPLHPLRRVGRGFNQSQYLAEEAAHIWNIPAAGCLLRIRNTKQQSLLPPKDREKNVRGAFRLKDSIDIKEKAVLLVDDVMTTGSTVNECARVLKAGGAARVVVLTFARGGGGGVV